LELGFEDQGAGTVASLDAEQRILWPLSASPSSAAKQAAESKRGQHNQSIEPSRPTKAAVLQSPMSA
jgi:hypothetical protein